MEIFGRLKPNIGCIHDRNNEDVLVSVIKYSLKKSKQARWYFSFSISGVAKRKFFANIDYFQLGIENNKIYFIPATKTTGYKLSQPQKNSSIYLARFPIIREMQKFQPNNYCGYYMLEFDQDSKYWYIDKNHKIKA